MACPVSTQQADILVLAYLALLQSVEALSTYTGHTAPPLPREHAFRQALAALVAEVEQGCLEAQP